MTWTGQISPQTNLLAAFAFGAVETIGFAIFGRDLPEPASVQRSEP